GLRVDFFTTICGFMFRTAALRLRLCLFYGSMLRISYALHSQMRLKSRMVSVYLVDLFELGYRGLGLSMVKHNQQEKAKIARAVSLSLLIVIVAIALLNSEPLRLGFAECQGGFTYLVE